MTKTKICVKCGKRKPATTKFFHRNKSCKDGLRGDCIECRRKYNRQYRQAHFEKRREYDKQYAREHKKEKCKYNKQYTCEHKKEKREYNKQYYNQNQGKLREQNQQYYQRNRRKMLEQVNRYQKTDRGRETKRAASKRRHLTPKGYLRRVYYDLNNRCTNPKIHNYHNYGGRGIRNKFKSFTEFFNYVVNELGYDTIESLQGLQIDRINNDGHNEKGNIRFVTCSENCKNRRPKKRGA